MKLGLIADIHADAKGLALALDHLDALGAEAVLCAGDLVDYGFWPDEAIGLIRACGIPCVRGNHDRKFLARKKFKARHTHPDALTPENLAYLGALPFSHVARYDGLSVALVHASPTDDEALIHPRFCPERCMADMLEAADADVLVTGHMHLPIHFETDAGVVVNPGSIFVHHGTNRRSSRTFGLLDTATMAYNVFDVVTGAAHERTTWPWWKNLRLLP